MNDVFECTRLVVRITTYLQVARYTYGTTVLLMIAYTVHVYIRVISITPCDFLSCNQPAPRSDA